VPSGRPKSLKIDHQLARGAQAERDVERVVHVRIVDQPFPADRRARLLEVHAHHEVHPLADFVGQPAKPCGVLQRGLRVVDRTRPQHDEEARVLARQDLFERRSAGTHAARGLLADRDLAMQFGRAGQLFL